MAKRVMKSIMIDEKKLREEISKRGLTLSKVSEELGHSSGFLNTMLCTNMSLKYADCLALQSLYGIQICDIQCDSVASNSATEKPESFDWKTFAQVVENAVYAALKRMSEGGE